MKAYRTRFADRQAAVIAELKAKAATPVIVEKVVERVVEVERIVKAPSSPAARSSKASKSKHPQVWESTREKAMIAKFAGEYSNPETAKRFQSNTKRAVTAIIEIKNAIDFVEFSKRQELAADLELLDQAAEMLGSYVKVFEKAKKKASWHKEVRETKRKRDEETKLAAIQREFFGEKPDSNVVTAMANDLLTFYTKIASWARQQHGATAGAYLDIDEAEIKRTLKNGNVTLIARAVANARLQMPTRGLGHETKDGRWWSGGWEDFVAWRAALKA